MVEAQNNPAGSPSDRDYRDAEPFPVSAQSHELLFFPAGADRLAALLAMITAARHTLDLCYYMFVDDESGNAVLAALTQAASRGVKVRLIVDGFASNTDPEFYTPLTEAGGRYWCFSAAWTRRYLIRNHQKLAIADGKIAIIGGFNVEQEYFAPPQDNGWHDLGLQIEGEVVEELVRWFDELEDWVSRPNAQFRDIRRKVKSWQPNGGKASLLIGGPTRGLSSWARCVYGDIAKGKRLDMVMAYFSPSRRMMRQIGKIGVSGEARLVMAGKSDNGATIGATRSLYSYLLGKCVRVWEFTPCKLHMKLIVIDDAVYIGSANFDMRSLYINLELMLRIEDAALAERMREFVDQQIEASDEITPQAHAKNAGLWNRIRWNLSWLLVGVLDYNISRRLNLGL